MPTPDRSDVEGYILSVNGVRFGAGTACIEIGNGDVCVYPMADADGSFPKGEEVTLGAFPTNANSEVTWTQVDVTENSIAVLTLARDRDVTLVISP